MRKRRGTPIPAAVQDAALKIITFAWRNFSDVSDEPKHLRNRILEIFEATRESPGEPYEQDFLVQYLIKNPGRSVDIHNTFKGKRRLSNFRKMLESEYTVCFGIKDYYMKSLRQFEERIVYLRKTPKSSLTTINNHLKDRPPDALSIAVCFIPLPFVAISVKLFSGYGLCIIMLPVAIVFLLYRSHFKKLKFYRNLEAKIKANMELNNKH